MKVQEAINYIEQHAYIDDVVKDMCIKALEKQIPKKPATTPCTPDAEYMKCPSCKLTTVLYHGMRQSYCGNCGQKLKWW